MQDVKATEKDGVTYVTTNEAVDLDMTLKEIAVQRYRAGMAFIQMHFQPFERRRMQDVLKDGVAVGALVAAQGWK